MISDDLSSKREHIHQLDFINNSLTKQNSTDEPLTVSKLNAKARFLLESGFSLPIWVIGEISKPSFKQSSGHLYFTLKDANAEISATFFRWAYYKNQLPLNSGDMWKCYGAVTLYEKAGSYQLKVSEVQKVGIGGLQAEFDRIKQSFIDRGLIKLNDAGMTDYEWKRPIPTFAQTIGIVSSPTAAGLKDLLLTINNRAPWMRIIVFPSSVQGSKAAEEVASAIEAANKHPDVEVIVVTRGGGSLEDLWCFNDEKLALSIANSKKPIISAIGHEVDFTICDFVADCRAATPTYAATILAPYPITNIQDDLKMISEKLPRTLRRHFFNLEQYIDIAEDRLTRRGLPLLLNQIDRKLDENQQRIINSARRTFKTVEDTISRSFGLSTTNSILKLINKQDYHVDQLKNGLIRTLTQQSKEKSNRIEVLTAHLTSNDPKRPVKRGFAIVRNTENEIVRDALSVSEGSRLSIEVAKGSIHAEVIKNDSAPNNKQSERLVKRIKKQKQELSDDQSENLFNTI